MKAYERLLKYAVIKTPSDESSDSAPSSACQFDLANLLKKEMEKLEKNLGGIKEMTEIPGVMFVVDPNKEKIAILEARKLGIPVIGLVDTNCNPEDVDYAIPGNDDAIRAVKLIMDVMANAVIEGRQGESMEQEVDEQEQMAEDAKPESMEEVVAAEAEENK